MIRDPKELLTGRQLTGVLNSLPRFQHKNGLSAAQLLAADLCAQMLDQWHTSRSTAVAGTGLWRSLKKSQHPAHPALSIQEAVMP
jgi:hypothetical protein